MMDVERTLLNDRIEELEAEVARVTRDRDDLRELIDGVVAKAGPVYEDGIIFDHGGEPPCPCPRPVAWAIHLPAAEYEAVRRAADMVVAS